MACQTHGIGGLDKIRVVLGSVNIMAGPTSHAFRVHRTRYEVVPLHPILVCGTFRPMGKRFLPELMLFQFPGINQTIARLIAHRPVVVNIVYRIHLWLSLGVALDADIDAAGVVQAGGIDDVGG